MMYLKVVAVILACSSIACFGSKSSDPFNKGVELCLYVGVGYLIYKLLK